MTMRRIVLTVDTSAFFDAATKVDRSLIGDRFVELMLDAESTRNRIALLALYGINVLSVTDEPPLDKQAGG